VSSFLRWSRQAEKLAEFFDDVLRSLHCFNWRFGGSPLPGLIDAKRGLSLSTNEVSPSPVATSRETGASITFPRAGRAGAEKLALCALRVRN